MAWLYRETICYYLFLKAASNPTVKWRDGKYRLKWGGLAEEIIEADKSTSSASSVSSVSSKKLPSNNGGSGEVIQPAVINKYSSNSSLNTSPGINTVLSPDTVKNLHMSHKRTNSYTVMMNSSSKSNQSLLNSNSDIESSPSQPLLANYSSGSPSKPFGHRAHHQHHHSISSPISFQSIHLPNSSIDDSKFTDLKIV